MAIIAIMNQKGGVGKTSTAVTLAHGLSLMGREENLVDLDSQGNVSLSLGMEKGTEVLEWLILEKRMNAVAVNARLKLDVIRSDKGSMTKVKRSISAMEFEREKVLVEALRGYDQFWDDVVLDCAPSVDVLHTAAMVAADFVVIPTRLDQASIEGVAETLESLATVRRMTGAKVECVGIIPTMYDGVTRESHAQLKTLASMFKSLVWPAVPQDTRMREGMREGKTVWELTPRPRAATAYTECLDRLVKLL
jgi:chromosome partitioning protein